MTVKGGLERFTAPGSESPGPPVPGLSPSSIVDGDLARVTAEGVGRVDAEHAEVAGEELQLLQRELQALILRMSFDIGVELRLAEPPAEHVALELDDVDA